MARPPPHPLGEERARSIAATATGNISYNCYCRWQLRSVGSNRGGPCVVFVRVDGRWCDGPCTYRDNVLARINAGVQRARARASARKSPDENPPNHPPGGNPPGLLPSRGNRS